MTYDFMGEVLFGRTSLVYLVQVKIPITYNSGFWLLEREMCILVYQGHMHIGSKYCSKWLQTGNDPEVPPQ